MEYVQTEDVTPMQNLVSRPCFADSTTLLVSVVSAYFIEKKLYPAITVEHINRKHAKIEKERLKIRTHSAGAC